MTSFGHALLLFLASAGAGLPRSSAKLRRLQLTEDHRAAVEVSHFGFLPGGTLQFDLENFTYPFYSSTTDDEPVGFSFTRGEEVVEFTKSNPGQCFFLASADVHSSAPGIYFLFNLKDAKVTLRRSLEGISVLSAMTTKDPTSNTTVDLDPNVLRLSESNGMFNIKFQIKMEDEDGYFVLMFHKCHRRSYFDFVTAKNRGISFVLSLAEKNPDSYLSAGSEKIPTIYMTFALIFFLFFCVWTFNLYQDRKNAYKVHYLMSALVLLKSLSVLLHGINFYYMGVYGEQLEAWAVLYYIFHLIKGSMLFATIILIGTGWTLFKNFLVERDRRLLMVIIPLQVLDNLAMVVMSETEIGMTSYEHWSRVFILVDLLCCVAVIVPILWSIKHLEQASQTDGKAVLSLQKLKLFQQFYVIVICYVYLTRIIKYLVQFTIPFKYMWITTVIEEAGTALLFLWTGVKFKPAPNNPYLKLAQTDDDDNYALTQSGAVEDVLFLSKKHKQRSKQDQEAIALDEAV